MFVGMLKKCCPICFQNHFQSSNQRNGRMDHKGMPVGTILKDFLETIVNGNPNKIMKSKNQIPYLTKILKKLWKKIHQRKFRSHYLENSYRVCRVSFQRGMSRELPNQFPEKLPEKITGGVFKTIAKRFEELICWRKFYKYR